MQSDYRLDYFSIEREKNQRKSVVLLQFYIDFE